MDNIAGLMTRIRSVWPDKFVILIRKDKGFTNNRQVFKCGATDVEFSFFTSCAPVIRSKLDISFLPQWIT